MKWCLPRCSNRRAGRWFLVPTTRQAFGFVIVAMHLLLTTVRAQDLENGGSKSTRPASPAADVSLSRVGDVQTATRDSQEPILDARPSWVKYPPSNQANAYRQPGVYLVTSGPQIDDSECRRVLDEKLVAAVSEFVASYLQNPLASELVRFDEKYVREKLVAPDHWYQESQQFAVGNMRQSYALVQFDEAFCQDLEQRWKAVIASSRLKQWALGAGSLLSLLGIAFAVLKMGEWMESQVVWRLKFAAVLAILMVAVAGMVVAQRIAWL